MKNLTRAWIASCSLLFVAACAGSPSTTASPAMLNSKCVVSGHDIDPGAPTADYEGGKVGFCCKDCVAKWNEMDAAAKKAAVAKK